jgi:hypothetical protein
VESSAAVVREHPATARLALGPLLLKRQLDAGQQLGTSRTEPLVFVVPSPKRHTARSTGCGHRRGGGRGPGRAGAEEVATELFEAGAILAGDPDVGVEIEALEVGLARAAGGDVTEVRLVAEAAEAGAGAGAEGDAALDGGAPDPGQDGRGFR